PNFQEVMRAPQECLDRCRRCASKRPAARAPASSCLIPYRPQGRRRDLVTTKDAANADLSLDKDVSPFLGRLPTRDEIARRDGAVPPKFSQAIPLRQFGTSLRLPYPSKRRPQDPLWISTASLQ